MKRKSRTPRQIARDYADKWFSKYIRARDYGQGCYTCDSPKGYMQCGHLITRAKYSTRWDPLNAKAQCAGCNKLHEYQHEHFNSKWIQEYGEAAYHELVRKSNTVTKFTTQEIQEIGDHFKELAEELSSGFPKPFEGTYWED